MLEALLYDLDGTVADTTWIYEKVSGDLCAELDIPFDDQTFLEHGAKAPQVWLEEMGIDEARSTIYKNEFGKRARVLLAQHADWRTGAREAFTYLREHDIPRAIITTAKTISVDVIDTRLGIRAYIQHIVGGEHVDPKFKPKPHGLLIARSKIEVDPAHCGYVGDQKSDMLAARNAGMTGILIPNGHTHPDAFSAAEIVVSNHDEILDLLG